MTATLLNYSLIFLLDQKHSYRLKSGMKIALWLHAKTMGQGLLTTKLLPLSFKPAHKHLVAVVREGSVQSNDPELV